MVSRSLNDLFASSTPEQRLMILRSEITTPIEVIHGYIALIKKSTADMNNPDLIEYIEEIEKAAERLKMLRNAII